MRQLDMDDSKKIDSDVTVENGATVLRKPTQALRAGWAEAAKSLATQGGDEPLMEGFANGGDAEFVWQGAVAGAPVPDGGQ